MTKIVGRLTRKHSDENLAIKILECKKTSPFPGMSLFMLWIPELQKIAYKVSVIDFSFYEEYVFSILKTRKIEHYIQIFNHKIKNNIGKNKPIALGDLGQYFSKFKISYIWLLKQNKEKKEHQKLLRVIYRIYLKHI